ncbi:hypothetical protein [Streptomyces sp. NRRL S-244]|uniref:hypothetical protein n=1 Tax=Streptomyces sp. NRRL S-244 TaxID=1463897 RepID=UPI001F3A7AEE|nr:hypothetical protein [Streptomyces sp. NRRL S-244]
MFGLGPLLHDSNERRLVVVVGGKSTDLFVEQAVQFEAAGLSRVFGLRLPVAAVGMTTGWSCTARRQRWLRASGRPALGEADVREKLPERWYERMVTPNRAFMLLGPFSPERSVVAGGSRRVVFNVNEQPHPAANSAMQTAATCSCSLPPRRVACHGTRITVTTSGDPPSEQPSLGRIWGE